VTRSLGEESSSSSGEDALAVTRKRSKTMAFNTTSVLANKMKKRAQKARQSINLQRRASDFEVHALDDDDDSSEDGIGLTTTTATTSIAMTAEDGEGSNRSDWLGDSDKPRHDEEVRSALADILRPVEPTAMHAPLDSEYPARPYNSRVTMKLKGAATALGQLKMLQARAKDFSTLQLQPTSASSSTTDDVRAQSLPVGLGSASSLLRKQSSNVGMRTSFVGQSSSSDDDEPARISKPKPNPKRASARSTPPRLSKKKKAVEGGRKEMGEEDEQDHHAFNQSEFGFDTSIFESSDEEEL